MTGLMSISKRMEWLPEQAQRLPTRPQSSDVNLKMAQARQFGSPYPDQLSDIQRFQLLCDLFRGRDQVEKYETVY